MQSPDEFNHFCRAYQISEGGFLPIKKDNRLGGEIPRCLKDFMSLYMPITFIKDCKVTYEDIREGFNVEFSDKERVFVDFPNTSYYSPVAYLPHACALFVLKQFKCSVGTLYYGTKLFVFLVWLLLMVLVLKMLPLFNWLFALLFLLPMNLYITTSFSADTATNILSFLLVAYILRQVFKESHFTKKDLIIIAGIAALLALTKIIYIGMLFLMLVIPRNKFKTVYHKLGAILIVFLLSFAGAYLWSKATMSQAISFEQYNEKYRLHTTLRAGVDSQKQTEHLMTHKMHLPKVILRTITGNASMYLPSYIGAFGTYLDTWMPLGFVIISFVLIIFVASTVKNDFFLSPFQKSVFFITALSLFSLLVLSQHLIWNAVGNDAVDSIQGRYLVPIFPLLFICFGNRWIQLKTIPVLLVILFVFVSNSMVCEVLYERYVKEIYLERVAIKCDAEKLDASGLLITSAKDTSLLQGGEYTDQEHRSGKYSILLNSDSIRGFVYKFEGLKPGDMVEISAWFKGLGGQVAVAGKGPSCPDFEYANGDVQMKDKNDWKKLIMVFALPQPCDSGEFFLFVRGFGQEKVFFDDVSYSIKKFKK